jgi:hypothetical protein
MIKVRFAALTGLTGFTGTAEFESPADALAAVQTYAASAGFTNVKIVDDDLDGEWRYTARTPGGRNGRNVAYATDFGTDEGSY